jgi:formate hydrogenlyase subunit 6/NADH:ubiquinone oxidoreductase subunit I
MTNKANKGYFQNLKDGITSSIKGLKLSFRHFKNAKNLAKPINVADENYFSQNKGIVTLQYPSESISVPEIGRYRLFNEMDDCIVCDKCAKICPVDCIDIEPIKATEQVGIASDGSPIRLYAAKFDIDMAKCCFCGLCTTVCPTECLTMTNTYDFSEFDVKDFNYHFANISPNVAQEKRALYEQFVLEKEALKKANELPLINDSSIIKTTKPVFRPAFKPTAKATAIENIENENTSDTELKKPIFKPSFKPIQKVENEVEGETNKEFIKPKPVFKPSFRPSIKPDDNQQENE